MAESYDRVRPSYPAELFDEIFSFAGLKSRQPAALLESGAGTGKATMVVAPVARSAAWSITCVEPDGAMAGVLERKLAQLDGLEWSVRTSGLEEYADSGEGDDRFSLLYAAQSWHWVAHERRARDAAKVLRHGGVLAAIWNVARPHPPELQADLDEVYATVTAGPRHSGHVPRLGSGSAVMPPSSPQPRGAGLSTEVTGLYERELAETGLFGPMEVRSRPWSSTHDTAEWLEVLETHSDHRILEPEVRAGLLKKVGAVIDAHGGVVVAEYDAVALLARRLAS